MYVSMFTAGYDLPSKTKDLNNVLDAFSTATTPAAKQHCQFTFSVIVHRSARQYNKVKALMCAVEMSHFLEDEIDVEFTEYLINISCKKKKKSYKVLVQIVPLCGHLLQWPVNT